jgi:hypothetical protein
MTRIRKNQIFETQRNGGNGGKTKFKDKRTRRKIERSGDRDIKIQIGQANIRSKGQKKNRLARRSAGGIGAK